MSSWAIDCDGSLIRYKVVLQMQFCSGLWVMSKVELYKDLHGVRLRDTMACVVQPHQWRFWFKTPTPSTMTIREGLVALGISKKKSGGARP